MRQRTNPLGLPEEVLCLALDQPYADLVVSGVKTLETRTWAWPYPPSWLAVYATKALDVAASVRLRDRISPGVRGDLFALRRRQAKDVGDLALGAIVGVVWIAGCRLMVPDDEQAACFPYEPGRYVWTVEQPHRFAEPDRTLSRGPQKFVRVPRRILRAALGGAAFDARLARDVAATVARHGLSAKSPGALPSQEVSHAHGFRVEFVKRDGARRMLDVGPGLRLWREDVALPPVAGALVRLRPPAGISPERVERIRGACVTAGAAAVKVLPPAAGPAVAPREVEAPAARGIRETVALVTAAARTKDRERLGAVLDAALAAEGV